MDFSKKKMKFKKLIVILIFVLQCSLGATEEVQNPILTPEDVRFARLRCQSHSTEATELLKFMWSQNHFPDDAITHCYVKCLLYKLGLIDLRGRGLAGNKLSYIWYPVSRFFDNDMCSRNFVEDQKLDNKCVSYYKKWVLFHEKCSDLAKYTFFEKGYESLLKSNFLSLPKSKKLGESATEFCESSQKKYEDILLDNRRNLDCVFRHFHYFDAYGRLDESEILRSFDEAKCMSSTNLEIVKKCTHSANMKYVVPSDLEMTYESKDYEKDFEIEKTFERKKYAMAFELKNCLEKLTEDFLMVYQHRNMISRQY